MSGWMWIALGAALLLVVLGAVLWRPMRAARFAAAYTRARQEFHRQREWLEVRFFEAAARSGRPRGLTWTNCDFDDDVAYARDRHTFALSAFVGVTISFEAIKGGLMEDVEAVGNLRAATAVFSLVRGQWTTAGRAIFNLNPTEAIAHFESELELVGTEDAKRG